MSFEPPSCAWKVPLDFRPTRPGKARGVPLKMIPGYIPVYMRIRKLSKLARQGIEPPLCFNTTKVIDDGFNQGIPVGGLGSGSIGRSFRGDFVRWHLDIGKHHCQTSLPNQFHLRIETAGSIFTQTLNPRRPDGNRLNTWAWGMDAKRAAYHALFPRAWTEYDFTDWGVRLVCEQLSPVIGNNYTESSFPVGIFAWRVTNTSHTIATVSLMLTWENALTPEVAPKAGDYSRVHQASQDTILLELGQERTDDVYPVSFGLGVKGDGTAHLSCNSRFDTSGHGADVWNDFVREGQLRNEAITGKQAKRTGAALCAKIRLNPGETKDVVFALTWDIPIMRFGSGREWYRRYTRFFDTGGDNATKIARVALEQWVEWNRKIEEWQKPVVESDRPDWLKAALFNEMYYLVDGGTAWETGNVEEGLRTEGIGHFGYLECFDYLFYNTYDVHFYTFALVMNFPEIDNSIQRDYADTVLSEDATIRRVFLEREVGPRKPLYVVPHDMGSPLEDPWFKTNAYRAQNVGRWKDLNTKFILQVYRNYHMTGDRSLLVYCWQAAKKAMEHIDSFDRDNDGLPENDGVPDQTYDTWTMKGPSAYCGGLYLAAAEAMVRMAGAMGESAITSKYNDILNRGKLSYESKLWSGDYYRLDASGGKHSDSIMADQLAGQWFALASGLDPIVPKDHARKALETIFRLNVMGYAGGSMGAMNGMRPDGRIDTTCIQSSEVWVGTTYALAALMIYEGLREEALRTAEGAYKVTYKERGYWFRTPEAWTADGDFRATMYMRPLTIWAIELALRSTRSDTSS